METERHQRQLAELYSLGFFLAAGLSIVMLFTDKNLQTDFGTVTHGYFVHWYAILGMALVDLAGGALLLVLRSRLAVKLGVIASALFAIVLVGAVFTYQAVGFPSALAFAQYLFGYTYFGGDIRYLYDLLLATYLGTCGLGVLGLALTRPDRSPNEPDHARASSSA